MSRKGGGQRRLRIIGGRWRGRTLLFADHPAIRPTPDRVRETLFNWLQGRIRGSRCLDLFAGSGALGLEALSRGADWVDFVERDRRSASTIRTHLQQLGASRARVWQGDALEQLQRLDLSTVDLIFLDPPFGQGLAVELLQRLQPCSLAPGVQLYLEVESQLDLERVITPPWEVARTGTAGQVRYLLLQPQEQSDAQGDLSGDL